MRTGQLDNPKLEDTMMQWIGQDAWKTRRLVQTWLNGFTGVLMATLVVAASAYATVELRTDELEEKTIRVENPEQEPLRVTLEPVQESFKVDEPIRFKIRGNKTFFLYLYNIDPETNEATLILPTKEGQKHNKYPANQTLMVPNQDEAAFLSDQAGRESLLIVASTKYLPIKSAWYRKGADHYVGKAEEFGDLSNPS
jgi:hypothetical protein